MLSSEHKRELIMIACQPLTPSSTEAFTAARLSKSLSKLLEEYYEKPLLEAEVKELSSVLRVDCAHLIMLARQELITEAQAGMILCQLEEIKRAGPERFTTKPGYGSLNLQIEAVLAEKLGQNIAGRLPIARSRIDHGATVRRVSDRENVLRVLEGLLKLQETLIQKAGRHLDAPIISYTHMQQAQPATFGHYLLAFKDRLQDSFQQLTQIYCRTNRNPLGAVGLAGTDLPIDRIYTTSLLGFEGLLDNSRLGRDAYYQIEIVFSLALLMTILNDLCSELHIQSSIEFNTIELDDSHCSTSSIFPQKKNPVALEAIKGHAGEAQGWVAAALAAFRNEGPGDQANRAVASLGDYCTTTANMLLLTSEIIERLTLNEARYEKLLSEAWVTTNRLGNILLTRHGLDYRTAHAVVGRLVKNCIDSDVPKAEVSVEMLQRVMDDMQVDSIMMCQDELHEVLDHSHFIRSCISLGSVGPQQVARLLAVSKTQYKENKGWLDGKLRLLEVADETMEKLAHKLLNSIAIVGGTGQHSKL